MLLLTEGTDELTRITERIQKELPFRLREFQLDVDGNGLILQGQARSYYEKQLVQEAALRTVRLPIAANDIAVCPDDRRR